MTQHLFRMCKTLHSILRITTKKNKEKQGMQLAFSMTSVLNNPFQEDLGRIPGLFKRLLRIALFLLIDSQL